MTIDTVYTYGNERISREMFQQASRTAYYLYDPRGSVSGLTDAKAHLTQTYRYSANGELTYGGAKHENEYTYNGESYNPNICSQYLRARYYNVTSARFLTEDSYLGDIAEPLTLNRYNYCISSWLNYVDPSGNKAFWERIKSLLGIKGSKTLIEKRSFYKINIPLEMKQIKKPKNINTGETYTENNLEPELVEVVPTLIEEHASEAIEGGEYEKCEPEFAGYLAYGAKSIVMNETEGFFKLYSSPTLPTEGERYFFADLYQQYGIEPYGALQSFGGSNSGLNYYGNSNYGEQSFDAKKGTLLYAGIERYAIAIGPALQNPDYDFGKIDPMEMAYGTCADISIVLEDVTYYIPAIIVDVKAHSAPTGIFQTGQAFGNEYVNTGKAGAIVEWYVEKKDAEGNNKSSGLNQFYRNGSIIIYRDEVLE